MIEGLVLAGAIVVLTLAGYAAYLHWQLYQLRKKAEDSPRPLQDDTAEVAEQRVALRKSIYLLADAMLDDKMTATEGCLRICAMASYLDHHQSFRSEYAVLFSVAEATAHIPILDEWQALCREDKKRFDQERDAIEQRYREALVEAVERLRKEFI